jgi:hypothetical protein
MNIPRNDSKVNRLLIPLRRRESVWSSWRSRFTQKIEAALELIVSVALHQVNDWLGGSLNCFEVTILLPGVEPEAIMKNTVVR